MSKIQDYIVVRGAKEHNLKNVDIDIPKNSLVVISGISGSGKSSLAFDTIYAEGQRRYVESLSSYARQFLQLNDKPNVESITGLSPAIAIDQKTTSKNPRSTVGTVTEIYDYLRLLFARIGVPYSPTTGLPIKSQTVSEMVDIVSSLENDTRIYILSPIARGEKGEFRKEILSAKKRGFQKILINKVLYDIDEIPNLEKTKKHDIDIVIDRVVISDTLGNRVAESIETALQISNGILIIQIIKSVNDKYQNGDRILLSEKYSCPISGFQITEIEPRIFSFNSPFGACPKCEGVGKEMFFDVDLIIPNENLSIQDGAIAPWSNVNSKNFFQTLNSVAKHYSFSINEPFSKINENGRNALLFGSKQEEIRFIYEEDGKRDEVRQTFGGVIHSLEEKYKKAEGQHMRDELDKYRAQRMCSECSGFRLKKESLCIKIDDLHIGNITSMNIMVAIKWTEELLPKLSPKNQIIADRILKEIRERLNFLANVGLEYLTLSRESGTLSGGESQRIRLASQIGSGLSGVLYVLDEPSIGLHQRDNEKLIATLKHLKSLGNTVIVVEHDEETMLEADYLVDVGPGAGIHGGNIIAHGNIETVKNNPNSITGQYLNKIKRIEVPKVFRSGNDRFIELKGATIHNLKNVDVKIPLGTFVAITGVSGSGKSSLIMHTLYKAAIKLLNGSKTLHGSYSSLIGLENIDKIIDIDQSPIGRTPRSNPATYIGAFTPIRDWFVELPESRLRGYKIGRFSFNVKGGRCEVCQGDGLIKVEMHFLPDVYVKCDMCDGKRYNKETLEVKYKSKSISDILEMNSYDAMNFFENIPNVYEKLYTLNEVGLSYLKIGQSATTLSGGEAQRIKLAKELSKKSTGRTLYILDEPTTGLHMDDIKRLLEVLHKLVDMGNTVLVIEHNLDVIKTADYIVDVGPEGGNQGGTIVATGTPFDIANCSESITGKFLKRYLRHSYTLCKLKNEVV